MIDHPAQRHPSPNRRTGLNFVAVAGTLQRTVKVPMTGKVLLYLYVHDGQAQTVVKAIVHDRLYHALPGRDQLEGAFLSVQGRIETVSRNQGQSTLQIVARKIEVLIGSQQAATA